MKENLETIILIFIGYILAIFYFGILIPIMIILDVYVYIKNLIKKLWNRNNYIKKED